MSSICIEGGRPKTIWRVGQRRFSANQSHFCLIVASNCGKGAPGTRIVELKQDRQVLNLSWETEGDNEIG